MTVKVGSGCSDGNGFQVAKRPPFWVFNTQGALQQRKECA